MRGRPRKPTKVLELSGAFERNPKRRKARANEPEPVGVLGDPPDVLDEAEKARWLEIDEACPWLASSDRALVELACELWMRKRRKALKETGEKLYVTVMRSLGMAPGERSRMSTPKAQPKSKVEKYAS